MSASNASSSRSNDRFKVLRVKNFQKHRDLTIEFDPQVTLITGKTDAGKSTIIRALALVCLGRWNGCYLRHGAKRVEVTLSVGDSVVFRAKGSGTNIYELDKKRFAAFANKVPEQIGKLTKISADNFQFQLDAHFWFGDTSGQVSKKLNEVVNLEVIDRTLSNVASELRSERARLQVCTERLRAAKEQVKETSGVPDCVAGFKRLVALGRKAEARGARCARLARVAAPAPALVRRAARARAVSRAFASVRSGASSVRSVTSRRAALARALAALDAREAHRTPRGLSDEFAKLGALRTAGDVTAERRRALEVFLKSVTAAEGRVCQLKEKASDCRRLLSEAGAKSSTRCPYCGATLPASARKPSSSRTSICPTDARSPGRSATHGRKPK